MFMPRISLAYKLGEKTVVKAGYGLYYDTLNATDYTANNLGYNSTTTNTNSTDFGQTFSFGGLSNPFPLRANGTRFDEPVDSTLGVNASAGSGFTAQNQNHEHARQQKWRVGIQREITKNTSIEIAYSGSYADRSEIAIRQDYLPQQYWISGSLNARDAAQQALLTANVTNPYNIANFASLRTTDPVLYARMASNSFFTSTTAQRNRLLRPFSQINNLTYDNLPLGEAKIRSIQIIANRRFSDGFTANMSVSFNSTRSNRTVQEYDREPTLWVDDNTSRPYRVTGSVGYELPFGEGKRMANGGGLASALAGGWQVASTFEVQPGSLIQFTTNTNGAPGGNVFYSGDIKDIKKSKPEIALNPDGSIDSTKYWFNIEGFERDPAKTPTSFQTRAFPFYIDGLRGPGLQYVNLNIVRTIRLGSRRTVQLRLDCQNLFNYAAYSNPNTDPTNTNFGKVVSAVGAAGAMRFFSGGLRFTF